MVHCTDSTDHTYNMQIHHASRRPHRQTTHVTHRPQTTDHRNHAHHSPPTSYITNVSHTTHTSLILHTSYTCSSHTCIVKMHTLVAHGTYLARVMCVMYATIVSNRAMGVTCEMSVCKCVMSLYEMCVVCCVFGV